MGPSTALSSVHFHPSTVPFLWWPQVRLHSHHDLGLLPCTLPFRTSSSESCGSWLWPLEKHIQIHSRGLLLTQTFARAVDFLSLGDSLLVCNWSQVRTAFVLRLVYVFFYTFLHFMSVIDWEAHRFVTKPAVFVYRNGRNRFLWAMNERKTSNPNVQGNSIRHIFFTKVVALILRPHAISSFRCGYANGKELLGFYTMAQTSFLLFLTVVVAMAGTAAFIISIIVANVVLIGVFVHVCIPFLVTLLYNLNSNQPCLANAYFILITPSACVAPCIPKIHSNAYTSLIDGWW